MLLLLGWKFDSAADASRLKRLRKPISKNRLRFEARAVSASEQIEFALEPICDLVDTLGVHGDEVRAPDEVPNLFTRHRFGVFDRVSQSGVTASEDERRSIVRANGERLIVDVRIVYEGTVLFDLADGRLDEVSWDLT